MRDASFKLTTFRAPLQFSSSMWTARGALCRPEGLT